MKKTFSSLFSGFGGADLGAKRLGLELGWGIELKDSIADVAIQNGHNVITQNILETDIRKLEPTDILHASPPCPNFSAAKQDAQETELDIALSKKVCEFIEVLQPEIFTLENVRGYVKSESFKRILHTLKTKGYQFNYWILNSANYGVPQSRIRLMLAASKNIKPVKPEPAHCKNPDNLFQSPWIGWYEAIEDIIDTLPESQFAQWQIDRLNDSKVFKNDFMITSGGSYSATPRYKTQPHPTIVVGHSSVAKAYLIHGANSNSNVKRHIQKDMPSMTIGSGDGLSHEAFLVDRATGSYGKSVTVKKSTQPSLTVTATQEKRPLKAWLNQGKVVKMTPRAIARFQDFPDSYELPDKKSLACEGLGNAVPPKLEEVNLKSVLLS